MALSRPVQDWEAKIATYTTYLGLKQNQGSDPFLLADFDSNLAIIDQNPGIFICTSGARPVYGLAQAGLIIFMTDLKQLSYWTGSAWQDLRDSAPIFAGGAVVNASLSPGSNTVYTILNFTTPRPCALAIILSANYLANITQSQGLSQNVTMDGTDVLFAGAQDVGAFSGGAAPGSVPLVGETLVSLAVAPSIGAGTHAIGLRVNTGNQSGIVELASVKVISMISLFASNNLL